MKDLLITMLKLMIPTVLIAILFSLSCSTINLGKLKPEYVGVDKRVQPLVNEYMELAKINGIKFNREVSIGFKKINRSEVVGVCNYGLNFREIDIDIDYWMNSSFTQRMVLVYHELTHCYCTRSHDYKDGIDYPSTEYERIKEALNWQVKGGERPGRFEDGCPMSIMYPKVVDSDCVRAHYQDYIEEMFNRCKPW